MWLGITWKRKRALPLATAGNSTRLATTPSAGRRRLTRARQRFVADDHRNDRRRVADQLEARLAEARHAATGRGP